MIRNFFLFFPLSLLSLIFITVVTASEIDTGSIIYGAPGLDYVEGEVLIKTKSNTGNTFSATSTYLEDNGLRFEENLFENNFKLLKITDDSTVAQKVTQLNNNPEIEYAEPNYYRYPTALGVNDTYADELWGLDNTGQTLNDSGGSSGTADADIDLPEAWALSEGDSYPIVVAIIDSGVGYNHPDLIGSMWDGTNCLSDTGATLGGCIHGYDFEDNDKNPAPTSSSHGTHIAGTIAATKDNTTGIVGVAPNAEIMAIKFGLDTASELRAINFAKQNGAKIINASYGGSTYSQAEYDAIASFVSDGRLFIAAAGNANVNIDSTPFYPAGFNIDRLISVAATDLDDDLASFSNYGVTGVDIAAPGVSILSTISDYPEYQMDLSTVTPPNLPSGYIGTNDWGTTLHTLYSVNILAPNVNGAGNLISPYPSFANSTLISPTYNLSDPTISGATLSLWVSCDTELTNPINQPSNSDYLYLQMSGNNGTDYTGYAVFNELMNGTSSPIHIDIPIQQTELTNQYKYKFNWVTNGTDNTHDGCWFDSVELIAYNDGSDEYYDYYPGTSMAAPHVAGLAALLWGTDNTITAAQVRDVIYDTGDSKASLSGQVATGKRINVANAIAVIDGKPVATPAGGDFSTAQSVALSTSMSGATIYYTTNGSTPTAASTVYSSPISISASGETVLKAIAINGGGTETLITTETYGFPIVIDTQIDIESRTNEASQLQMALIPSGGGSVTKEASQSDASGNSSVRSIQVSAGSYDVYFKPEFFLSRSSSATLALGSNPITFSSPFLAGDLSNDDMVNGIDYSLFAAMYGSAGNGDFNGDGIINAIDFALLARNYSTQGEYLVDTGNAWTW